MEPRPEADDAPTAADALFADVPAFDVVEGELMPRRHRRRPSATGTRPAST